MDRLVEHYATLSIKDEELDTVLAGAGVFIDLIQSETDSLRTEASQLKTENEGLKTAAEKAKSEENKEDTPPKDDPAKPAAIPKELTDFMNEMKTAMQTMQGQVTGMQAKTSAEKRLETFKAAMEAAKIPEAFYRSSLLNREFKDDADVSALVEDLKTNHATFTSVETSKAANELGSPIKGDVDPKSGISSLMAGYLASKKTETEGAKA